MGIIADATLAAGGPVVGIIPEHIQVLEVEHTGLSCWWSTACIPASV